MIGAIGGIAAPVPTSSAPATCGIPKACLPTVCAPKPDSASISKTGMVLLLLDHEPTKRKRSVDLAILLAISVQDLGKLVEACPLLQMTGGMVAMVGACAAPSGAA